MGTGETADLSDAGERARRQALLAAPHVAPLADLARALARERRDTIVPMPDPLDGGVQASVLFLLEKPSRLASGSRFISRDNASNGARTLRALMDQAGVPRGEALIWNAVPWWNGTAAVTGEEQRAGAGALDRLLALMPRLRSVALVGRKAERVWSLSGRAAVPVFVSAHPSANVRAAFPDRWAAIPGVWAEAWRAARGEDQCAASGAPVTSPKT